jgi:uroporphyrinogen decarboxylase
MKTNKKLLSCFRNPSPLEIPPIWLMRQAGRYLPEYREERKKVAQFMDFCFTPNLAKEVTLQPLKRFNFDASIIFSDILVIPHVLGCAFHFVEQEGPQTTQSITHEWIEAANHKEDIKTALGAVYEAIDLVKKELPEHVTLIGFSGSPWTLAAYMLEGRGSKDYIIARSKALKDPILMDKLLNLLVKEISIHCIRQIESGAEVIQLFDSWSGVLNPYLFDKWVIEPTARIVEEIRRYYPDIPIIGFPRLAGMRYRKYAIETRVNGISVDTNVDLNLLLPTIPEEIVIQGNLDPAWLLVGNDPLRQAVKRILHAMKGRRHIFNLGHGITPEANINYVSQLIEDVKSGI